jgi:hypothetical protein
VRLDVKSKTSGTVLESHDRKERIGKLEAQPPTKDPTKCDNCGNRLGMWFSLADKAYCSPCFHAKFWTPFQSAPSKSR